VHGTGNMIDVRITESPAPYALRREPGKKVFHQVDWTNVIGD
jgi:hypothetical protein